MISAVFSRFSGGFKGYRNVREEVSVSCVVAYRFSEKEIVVFRLDSQVFEYRV